MNQRITIDEETMLVGFRFDADSDSPNLYTFINQGEENTPILRDNKFILFSDTNLALSAIELADNADNVVNSLPDEPYWADFSMCLYLLDAETVDTSATLLNLLNVLSDMFLYVHIKLPFEYRDVLNTFAKHLTFHREFGQFLESQQIDRSLYKNALVWCLGTLLTNSHLILGTQSEATIPPNS